MVKSKELVTEAEGLAENGKGQRVIGHLTDVPDLGWGLPNGREIFAWAESNCSGFFWRFLS